ncbi:hypothetical protein CY34DRAFT_798844 [Suillus luteus UH-Slu-Lm8-n1]|uniref:Uncharacterized protein n=1 Tax=Suillus luteus UH-Slu-Lm8-n1 TaxID=930992 RepID=A0A0D0B1X1_9AGAM|nr:hypothetical protein CY34DRAFT_798844 [Suillus luteus UH-Slu-Lm8-n1]
MFLANSSDINVIIFMSTTAANAGTCTDHMIGVTVSIELSRGDAPYASRNCG